MTDTRLPRAPNGLTAEGRGFWREHVRALAEGGHATPANLETLRLAVTARERAAAATAAWERAGRPQVTLSQRGGPAAASVALRAGAWPPTAPH
jgi:hypothetical protein